MITKDEFKVGKHNIGWVHPSFFERVPDEFEERKLGTFHILPRDMTDEEIENELKPDLSELGDIVAFLDNQSKDDKDDNWRIFFVNSYVVSVGWWGTDYSKRSIIAWKRGVGYWKADSTLLYKSLI